MKKFIVLILTLLLGCSLQAQQPQTQNAPSYNANAITVNGTSMGYFCTPQSGLILACGGGTSICNNVTIHYPSGTLTLNDNATNYVFLDPDNSCVPKSNTTGFPDGAPRIGTFPTSGGSITQTGIDDLRSWAVLTKIQVTGSTNIFVTAGDMSGPPGSPTCTDALDNITNNGCSSGPGGNPIRDCEILFGDPGAASPALLDDNDAPAVCGNDTTADLTITAVACWANAGSPTVNPILTGGSGTSILSSPITCGTGSWAAGSVNGSPVIHSFGSNGATCSSPPCSIDANIGTAGGTAKYIVLRIKRTL